MKRRFIDIQISRGLSSRAESFIIAICIFLESLASELSIAYLFGHTCSCFGANRSCLLNHVGHCDSVCHAFLLQEGDRLADAHKGLVFSIWERFSES